MQVIADCVVVYDRLLGWKCKQELARTVPSPSWGRSSCCRSQGVTRLGMALAEDRLIVPIMQVSGNVWVLENVDR